MVLGGRVNKSLVSLIQQAGGKAVGLCGKDGDLLRARQMVEKDIGCGTYGLAARGPGGEPRCRRRASPVVPRRAAPAVAHALLATRLPFLPGSWAR